MAGFIISSHSSLPFSPPTRLWAACAILTGATAYGIYRQHKVRQRNTILPPPLAIFSQEITNDDNLPSLSCARDVASPWGTMRVYECGSAAGPRILLIHGISMPSVGLRDLANGLVESGCRVMLFDLWGHGHSGTPPTAIPHDTRLYTAQILLALTTSPISWTGKDPDGMRLRFSIVAYSMGAGLALSFTVDQPELVHRLVLLAPGSLLRSMPRAYANPLALAARHGPSWVARWWMRAILGAGLPVEAATTSERQDNGNAALEEARLWHWQLTHNPGFVHSFVSALDHAPIQGQHSVYRKLRNQLAARKARAPNDNRVLVVLGGRDPYTLRDETVTDALGLLGSEHAAFVVFEGEGHEFPRTRGRETAKVIWKFWNNESLPNHEDITV